MVRLPENQGLYLTDSPRDNCGIGAVVNIAGRASHSIIENAKQILLNLQHRGSAGADETTGDGAGILFQIPHEFFSNESRGLGFSLPEPFKYAVGVVFSSKSKDSRNRCEKILEEAIANYDLKVIGWRDVPVKNNCLGKIALEAEPSIRQIFVDGCGLEPDLFERKLYLARKRAEKIVSQIPEAEEKDFYVVSLSCRTICYKGMFMARQLFDYYPDLADASLKSALAIVHQRYSTNTFPNWQLAQPFRCIAHNGEINTLRGNRNQMLARQSQMPSPMLGGDISELFPIFAPAGSDSECFDNALELLVQFGPEYASFDNDDDTRGVRFNLSYQHG